MYNDFNNMSDEELLALAKDGVKEAFGAELR